LSCFKNRSDVPPKSLRQGSGLGLEDEKKVRAKVRVKVKVKVRVRVGNLFRPNSTLLSISLFPLENNINHEKTPKQRNVRRRKGNKDKG
jgi:hypothetical protein